MKNRIILAVALLGLLVAPVAFAASSSWQSYSVIEDRLIVTYGDQFSAICYDGPAVGYDGSCVEPKAPSMAWYIQWLEDQRLNR